MATRREYLVSAGLAKPGRGKFSGAALVALDKARSEGVKFSDDDSAPRAVSATPKPTNSTPKPVGIISDIVYTYPESDYIAYEKGTKIERSMRSVCQGCHPMARSLVVHSCLTPAVVSRDGSGTVAVTIEKRK